MGWEKVINEQMESDQEQQKEYAVLVVDDDSGILQTIEKFLKDNLYTTYTASNGEDALQIYEQKRPRIILTDLKMPGLSGIDLLKKIRATDNNTEIIVFTAFGDMTTAIEALRFKATDFLLKPINLEIIQIAIEKAEQRLKLKQEVSKYTVDLENLLNQINYSKRYLETVIHNSPVAMFTYNKSGEILSWNVEAEKITGYTADEAAGKIIDDLFRIESRLIQDVSAENSVENVKNSISQILTKEQEIRYISRNANILRDEDENPSGAIESFVDVTEQVKNDHLLEKRYLQLQTINEIGKIVTASHSVDEVINFISKTLVETFFESSQVTIFLSNGEEDKLRLSSMAGLHIERVAKKYPLGTLIDKDSGIIGKVFSEGGAQIITDVRECEFYIQNPDNKMGSVFTFPIRSKDNVFGVLNIENSERMNLEESDKFMLEVIAESTGISMERIELLNKITEQNHLLGERAEDLKKALHEVESHKNIIEEQNTKLIKDLKKAAEFQKSLLPESIPEFEGIQFVASYLPSFQLGGDFYYVIKLTDELVGVLVADASGHGVASAMLTAMFKMTFEKYALEIHDPAEVFERLNKDFCAVLQSGEFFTAFYGILNLETREFIFSNAAHPKALLYSYKDKSITELDSEGFLLGVLDKGITYETSRTVLNEKSRLLIYTDGVNEAHGKKQKMYGNKRVQQLLKKYSNKTPQKYIELAQEDLVNYVGQDAIDDDVTIIVMDIQ